MSNLQMRLACYGAEIMVIVISIITVWFSFIVAGVWFGSVATLLEGALLYAASESIYDIWRRYQ